MAVDAVLQLCLVGLAANAVPLVHTQHAFQVPLPLSNPDIDQGRGAAAAAQCRSSWRCLGGRVAAVGAPTALQHDEEHTRQLQQSAGK